MSERKRMHGGVWLPMPAADDSQNKQKLTLPSFISPVKANEFHDLCSMKSAWSDLSYNKKIMYCKVISFVSLLFISLSQNELGLF